MVLVFFDLQNTTQNTLDRATLTRQSTNIRQTMIYKKKPQKTLDRTTLRPQSTNIRQTTIYKTVHRKH